MVTVAVKMPGWAKTAWCKNKFKATHTFSPGSFSGAFRQKHLSRGENTDNERLEQVET